MFQPNREELAWAAGFFDGEGNVLAHTPSGRPTSVNTRVDIGQVHYEPLKRFQNAIGGLGRIKGPYPPAKMGRSAFYRFTVSNFEHAQAIGAMLWPWLCNPKRAQFELVLRRAHEVRRKRVVRLRCARGHIWNDVFITLEGDKTCRACWESGERSERIIATAAR